MMRSMIYEGIICYCILLFAVYDVKWRRVPNQALVFFCPVAVMAPFIRAGGTEPLLLGRAIIISALGAVAAFCILLTAAMISKKGAGIGGGDIKLATVMGFIYGSSRMSLILLVASLLAAVAACLFMAGRRREGLSLPYVPFLACGSVAVTVIQIMS